jgi:hypothetical protein
MPGILSNMNQDLQAKVRTFESLNWLERNLTGPWGATPEQKNECYFANYWLNAALNKAQDGDYATANIYLGIALEHIDPSGVDFSNKLDEVRKYIKPVASST